MEIAGKYRYTMTDEKKIRLMLEGKLDPENNSKLFPQIFPKLALKAEDNSNE